MTMAHSGARIGVVDDHEQIVRGLRATLVEQPDMTFAGGAATLPDLLASTADLSLVLLDLRLDDDSTPRDNIGVLSDKGIPTLVYTSGDEMYLIREAATAGTLGVVRKNAREPDLLAAIRVALTGDTVAGVDWASAIDSDHQFVDLSPQQRRVLQLYAAGESQIRVAHELGISSDTVTDYVNRIRDRYRSAGRAAPTKIDLYKRAIEDGWLPIPRRRRRA
ncbi:LuxR C-terminal-related transcriptional regulator [Gordonia aichiensis]|uniref:LuxR C-terminal-related transcriptional regulator n=1 Tax=Gordonia aichiensis TaxID=36820 RepID=UPI003262FDED